MLRSFDAEVNYVVQEAIVVIRDIFRKYPGKCRRRKHVRGRRRGSGGDAVRAETGGSGCHAALEGGLVLSDVPGSQDH